MAQRQVMNEWSTDPTAIRSYVFEHARVRRNQWAEVGKAAIVGGKGDREYAALTGDPRPLAGREIPGGYRASGGMRRPLRGVTESMKIEVLDPTHYDDGDEISAAARPNTLVGATVGVVSNGRQGTGDFFDALESELRRHHGVAEVVRVTKANYSAPAERTIMDRARQWHALITGVGD
jgi:hypothetical protein